MIIDLWAAQNAAVACCICGREDSNRWGIPVNSETAQVVANDFSGDWGCRPACQSCHDRHAAGEFVGTYPKGVTDAET